ncbi:MAG: metallophosphoesterase [Bdellovibrionales bacterium]|nr:metallophosphoesterase [Bdellovibrionales bacterium]
MNSPKRTIIVGDVHGCLTELEELLAKLVFDKSKDRLIFVGDLVNKGPDSIGVLKLTQSLNAEVVMGNHDLGLLEGTSKLAEQVAIQMGEDLDYWKSYISSFKPYIEDDNFIVVHAGFAPNQSLAETDLRILTRIRTWDGKGEELQDSLNPAWFEFYKGSKLVVFGHWARLGLMQKDNVVCLDSSCVYGGELSALVLPEKKIVQVKARKNYTKS